MSCINNCPTCPFLLKTTNVSITGTSPNQVLTLTIPTTSFKNLDRYCLAICQSIPTTTSILPVKILNGTTSITVLDKDGNTLRSDQIRKRNKYKIVYGNDPIHILVRSCVCPTSFTAPTVSETNE